MFVSKVLVIALGFTVINSFMTLLIDTAINSIYSAGPSAQYDFGSYVWLAAVVGIISGALGGAALVSINEYVFRKKSFGFALRTTALFYTLVFLIVNILNSVISTIVNLENPGLKDFVSVASTLLINPFTLVIFGMWGIISLFTLFLLQVNDKFGPGVLWKFLKGRYYQPTEEERIFLFVDIRSSTSIAERIGHKNYFHLLSDLFADITDTILHHEGEIYQYVGDEIIISWQLQKGIRNRNFLECFLQIERKLMELGPAYVNRYGVAPEVKAGIHYGSVMAGEIGVIKRDIVYSGDVLNTTARIQEQCNHYQVNLLASEETLKLIDTSDYTIESKGIIELRGKEQNVNLLSVSNRVSSL